jgi:thiol-disulfide isomerase/thioredoxin
MRLCSTPEIPEHLEWLNSDTKYSLHDLRGKIVLLDFWTFCCINCIHVLPDLKRLEKKYPELVVIGVHSAKFHNEQLKQNILDAILRYEIEHPVIIDNDFLLWNRYRIRSWPSFVLIDPAGKVALRAAGEGIFERWDPVIMRMSETFEKSGMLDRERIRFRHEAVAVPAMPLKFPGKIAVDVSRRHLLVSDSNHNRVVILDLDGSMVEVIGSGEEGSADGDFARAEFSRPQGLIHDRMRDCIYVADTGNHLIRQIDIAEKQVTTLLGTGRQAGFSGRGGRGRSVSLNSPWALTRLGDHLYIAMAGAHQIWRMHLSSLRAEPYAGSGYENLSDGPVMRASFAQPSGIATDGTRLFVADSEASAIRMIDQNMVTTLIGTALFDFGDRDGSLPSAQLQHPLGVFHEGGSLYIADSYNHKIKRVDLREGTISTLIGTGSMGSRDGKPLMSQLNEPNDLAYLDGVWYICDTNNHLIRIYDPKRDLVSTLTIRPS